jgi:hypothetical protein
MGSKRFPIGDVITLVGAAIVAVGVSLTWYALQITASQGTATFSLWGWQFALGWVAGIAAAVGAAVGLAGLLAGGRLGRIGGYSALACGLVALAAVGIQLAGKPDVAGMNKQIGSSFSAADLAQYNQKMNGWTVSTSTVETGSGLWVALTGSVLVLVGGGLAVALGGKKAPAVAGAWQPGAYAPVPQPDPYGQSPYQPPAGAYPGPAEPPPMWAPPAAPVAAPAAFPEAAFQPAAVVETPAYTDQTPPPTAGDMVSSGAAPAKFCAKCGAVFDDDQSRFCVACGTPRAGVG